MKKVILSLFVWFLGIISFGYCDYIGGVQYRAITNSPETLSCNGLCCFMTSNQNTSVRNYMRIEVGGETLEPFTSSYATNQLSCFNFSGNFSYYTTSSSFLYFRFYDIPIVSNSCPTCPEVNTGEILSGYILESDINNLYCEEHGYCPIIDTGEELSGMSTLFINDIEHQSAPLINITIPEEYNRDSSVDTGEFNLVISGTNVDYEYIDNIIRTQNSKPSSEDLTNIVSGLIPLFIPGLCIILLLYFIYLFIKKIF